MATAFAAPQLAAPTVCPSGRSIPKSSFCGTFAQGLPAMTITTRCSFRVEASGAKKITSKAPLGPSGDTKFKGGLDASGQKAKGKGVYQYAKKYGANVDGYSPIYVEEEWAKSGSTYAGGQTGLALWAVTFAGLIAAGAFLVYSTSALSA